MYVSKVRYEGRHVQYAKISLTVKEAFSQLTAGSAECRRCSNSLAAFVIERG